VIRALAGIATAVAVLAAGEARAADGENALSVSLSYGRYSIPDHAPHGSVLGFDYERGFADNAWLRLSGGGGLFFESGEEEEGLQRSYTGHATLGLTYIFDDTLKYVLYGNLGLGAIVLGGQGVDRKLAALVELGLGLDIQRSRTFSYGAQVRFESFLSETAFFTAGARATWRWGFF
jgi:hypothetical protein